MTDIEQKHAAMVASLMKPPEAVHAAITVPQAGLIHATMGISGEAGELLDAVKKHVIYQKPIDIANVIEELGDLEFYLCEFRSKLRITRAATLEANMAKLAKRYPNYQYTDQRAQERADKAV